MNYDLEIFESFRAKAITRVEDLVIGNTYWSNADPRKSRVLAEITDYSTFKKRQALTWEDEGYETSPKPAWMFFTDGTHASLRDSNIGNSYNPWLIFETEQDALECNRQLVIDFSSNSVDWAYD